MPTTYRYGYKDGHLYTTWVTKQRKKKRPREMGLLGRAVVNTIADVGANMIRYSKNEAKRQYCLGRDVKKVMGRREPPIDYAPILDASSPNSYGGAAMDELDKLIVNVFLGKTVRKDLTSQIKRSANVPTFVLEYLLGLYCSTDDEDAVQEGLKKIRTILSENYVRSDESERIKSRIREKGEYTVIDKLSAKLDEFRDMYIARFTNLEIEPFIIPSEYVSQYSKILTGGLWCICRIAYIREEENEEMLRSRRTKRGPEDSPFRIVSLQPIQLPSFDVEEFISHREQFTFVQWEDLLLRSAGYEPDHLTDAEKLHFIERMVPLVERNYNFCELGPRGTGKSHIYKEISPYSILMSGGQTTASNLFYNLRQHRTGLVGHWDCVAFDEVAGMHFRDMDAIQILKDYMASGSFARGRDSINADASLVYIGNINDSVRSLLKNAHLFDPFPPEFHNDSAFFDRIHFYLPGWEIPKMRSNILTNKYGLITDCLSEFCKEMRKFDFSQKIDEYFQLNQDFNKRDEIAVRKTFSGLAKLLFPDGRIAKREAGMLLCYAIEGRRRVKEQLKVMVPEEFADVNLGFTDLTDGKMYVIPVAENAKLQ